MYGLVSVKTYEEGRILYVGDKRFWKIQNLVYSVGCSVSAGNNPFSNEFFMLRSKAISPFERI